MLPELIYREEQSDNLGLLFVFGLACAVFGYFVGRILMPDQVSLLSVVFAAIPIMYPLTRRFLEDEKDGRPHLDEVLIYGSLFAGEVVGFFLLMMTVSPSQFHDFYLQIANFSRVLQGQMNIVSIGGVKISEITQSGSYSTGMATSGAGFMVILANNIFVFSLIFLASVLVSSAGAFILVWNASVFGIFLGVLTRKLSASNLITGTSNIPSPVTYLPHAVFEMSGFIIAGISGSLVSAAIYREHFDRDTWVDYGKLVGLGLACILIGALLEGL